MPNTPDFQPVTADRQLLPSVVRGTGGPQPAFSSAVWTSDASAYYQLNTKCQDFITRYLGRSLLTPDDPNMIHVNRKLLQLGFAVSVHSLTLQKMNARVSNHGTWAQL